MEVWVYLWVWSCRSSKVKHLGFLCNERQYKSAFAYQLSSRINQSISNSLLLYFALEIELQILQVYVKKKKEKKKTKTTEISCKQNLGA